MWPVNLANVDGQGSRLMIRASGTSRAAHTAYRPMFAPRVEDEAVVGTDVVRRSKENVPEDPDLLGALEAEANAVAQPDVVRKRRRGHSEIA